MSRRSLLVGCLAGLILVLVLPAAAQAKKYSDVPAGFWASSQIGYVTSKTIDGQRLMDDYGKLFKPSRAITRAQCARLLVLLAGKHDGQYTARELPDVPADNPYYADIQLAIKYGLLPSKKDGFHPDDPVLVWQFDRALIRVTRMRNPGVDWTMLKSLSSSKWEPNPGWKPKPPSYFATEVAARWLEYRPNQHGSGDALELSVVDPIRRSDVAYSVNKLLTLTSWRLQTLSYFNKVTFPTLSPRQREIATFAFKWVGYPHIYGGEYPTKNSPYGYQLHGGFDCSGFTWWVMKMNFKYPIPIGERSAAQMAGDAKPRITRGKLQAFDLIFWGPAGPKSSVYSIYHAGLYLGNGWFIHSTGSSGGVSIASLDWASWAWKSDFAWGRRVLKKSELPPGASPTASPSASPTASPSTSASPSPSP